MLCYFLCPKCFIKALIKSVKYKMKVSGRETSVMVYTLLSRGYQTSVRL